MAKKHCSRCGGYGYISGYSHVKGGVCFKCGGKATKSTEEIQAERKTEIEANKEYRRKQKIECEYPYTIAKKKQFLATLIANDEPFESEEEEKTFYAFVDRTKAKIAEMEAELQAVLQGH